MRLDERILKDEGFFLGVGDEEFDVLNIWDQKLDAETAIPRFAEIGAYPAAQVFGFADVENRALPIFHEVHAWLRRHQREFSFQVHRYTYTSISGIMHHIPEIVGFPPRSRSPPITVGALLVCMSKPEHSDKTPQIYA